MDNKENVGSSQLPSKNLVSLLEYQLNSTENRYRTLRNELSQTLESNAKLLEYVQHVENQLSFYKHKSFQQQQQQQNGTNQTVQLLTNSNNDILAQNIQSINPQILSDMALYQKLVHSLSNDQGLTIKSFLSSMCSTLSFDAASIYSISHSLNTFSCEQSTLNHLNNASSFALNEGILSQIIKQKQMIIIEDVNQTQFTFDPVIDDRFYSLNDDNRKTLTVCLQPLFNANQEMIGILEFICSKSKSQDYENKKFKQILIISRNIASNLLATILQKRQFECSNIHKEAILELAKIMTDNSFKGNNIEMLIEKVRKAVYRSIDCDKCTVFLVDEMRQELWCNASEDVAGIRLPSNKGIVGHTVTSGEVLNIVDAYKDKRFCADIDGKTNYYTKTILCVPIESNGKIIGAVECINKKNGAHFTKADELLLTKMAAETAPTLQNKFMESALRIITQNLQDSSTKAYLAQFMHNENNWWSRKNVKEPKPRKRVVSVSSCQSQVGTLPKLYLKLSAGITVQNICTWDFDYFKLMKDDYQTVIPIIAYMFNDFGLLERFNISEKKLYSFLVAVKKHYYDIPYHNFLHAFSVMHVCYLILKKTTMVRYFTALDVLTIFISAICHDVEHPGLTNAYQVNSGSDLSLVYNDRSVLENHHAHVASVLLKQPDTAILSELTLEERSKFRQSMISTILHTDMSYHQDVVSKLVRLHNTMFDDSSSDTLLQSTLKDADKQFLCETIVHLGDLSNPVMRWDQSHEWSQRVIAEFILQSKLENEQELKRTMVSIGDKSPESVSKVQTSFIDYVVRPLWKNAANIAPELQDRLAVLDKNKQTWLDYPAKYHQLGKKKQNEHNKNEE